MDVKRGLQSPFCVWGASRHAGLCGDSGTVCLFWVIEFLMCADTVLENDLSEPLRQFWKERYSLVKIQRVNLNRLRRAGTLCVTSVGIGYMHGLFLTCHRWWMPEKFAMNGSEDLDRYYNHLILMRGGMVSCCVRIVTDFFDRLSHLKLLLQK